MLDKFIKVEGIIVTNKCVVAKESSTIAVNMSNIVYMEEYSEIVNKFNVGAKIYMANGDIILVSADNYYSILNAQYR